MKTVFALAFAALMATAFAVTAHADLTQQSDSIVYDQDQGLNSLIDSAIDANGNFVMSQEFALPPGHGGPGGHGGGWGGGHHGDDHGGGWGGGHHGDDHGGGWGGGHHGDDHGGGWGGDHGDDHGGGWGGGHHGDDHGGGWNRAWECTARDLVRTGYRYTDYDLRSAQWGAMNACRYRSSVGHCTLLRCNRI